jgi:hypothetical protein
MAVALEWVSRITTAVLMMVLPGLGGQWLDEQWGTGFVALLGFAFGLTTGVWYLLQVTREPQQRRDESTGGNETNRSANN